LYLIKVLICGPKQNRKSGHSSGRALFLLLLGFLALVQQGQGSFAFAADGVPASSTASESAPAACQRLISLAPSLTEVVYALGLGQQLVGVTRYCRYPAAAQAKPKVGGFLDPSVEGLLLLRPSRVLLLQEQGALAARLDTLNIESLRFEQRTLAGILESIERIGALCGREHAAEKLLMELRAEMAAVGMPEFTGRRVRVLLVIGSGRQGEQLRDLYISGNDGFYNDLIGLAGGENVAKGGTAQISPLAVESVLALRPELILQVIDSPESDGRNTSLSPEGDLAKAVKESWSKLPVIGPSMAPLVQIINEDWALIPGPRFPLLLRRMRELIAHSRLLVSEDVSNE
jgi:iron complex transport system substrate-binding protein